MGTLTKLTTNSQITLPKEKNTFTAPEATVEVFWRAYETLKPRERQALAERILRDRKLLEDLGDHILIEKAKRVKGKPITLSEYAAGRHQAVC